MKPYQVLAYYHFTPLADPHTEVINHKNFLKNLDFTCRIYISEEGINGQACGSTSAVAAYMEWMKSHPDFKEMPFKIHEWHEQAFPRLTIKYRKHLVGVDQKIDLSKRGQHVPPAEWKEMMKTRKDCLLIDTRNEYEWKLGHFEGADLPACDTFREFETYADNLSKEKDPAKTPVMMYCTGGIRCELYSSILIERGFTEVYQLEGGIINYGLKAGSEHWKGKLFVFDDRLSVPISHEETPVVGKCHHCQTPSESYYNCANMDCNTLYLCCPACVKTFAGCCQTSCQNAERVRPYQQQNPHKPFRKKHHYEPDVCKE